MEASLRNTPALTGTSTQFYQQVWLLNINADLIFFFSAKIERSRDELIKRFENLISLAGIEKNDRNLTATSQFQIQVETTALIRAVEDVQSLIRQMQEAWLFGQLNTIGESQAQKKVDDDSKIVADLLKQLLQQQAAVTTSSGDATT